MNFDGSARIVLAVLVLVACSRSPDADMWECQLDVQKGNAGRSLADVSERARDIDACMAARGFRLDLVNTACQPGAVISTCYLSK